MLGRGTWFLNAVNDRFFKLFWIFCDFSSYLSLLAYYPRLIRSCNLFLCSTIDFIFEDLNLVVALHYHRLLLLAFSYFIGVSLLRLFHLFLILLNFFFFPSGNLLILFSWYLLFFELIAHLFDLILQLNHYIARCLHLDRCDIKSLVEISADFAFFL